MIDIHCHIVPGVDDGPKNMEDAIEMARIAMEDGITKIVATPHYFDEIKGPSRDDIRELIKNMNEILKENRIEVEILWGNEIYITPNLPALVKKGHVNTINDTQYLLMELPMFQLPNYTEQIIYELRVMGIIPIIAHPERYNYVIKEPYLLMPYMELGALCQMNTGSLRGLYGQKVKETAEVLLKSNMIHLFGSDGHSPKKRVPKLKDTYNRVAELTGSSKAKALFYTYPQMILEGLYFEGEQPVKINRFKSPYQWLNQLKRQIARRKI